MHAALRREISHIRFNYFTIPRVRIPAARLSHGDPSAPLPRATPRLAEPPPGPDPGPSDRPSEGRGCTPRPRRDPCQEPR